MGIGVEAPPGKGTGSIGNVASRARRCSDGVRCWGGIPARGDEAEDIPEAVAPVGIMIVGSGVVTFFLGVTGRTGSDGVRLLGSG